MPKNVKRVVRPRKQTKRGDYGQDRLTAPVNSPYRRPSASGRTAWLYAEQD